MKSWWNFYAPILMVLLLLLAGALLIQIQLSNNLYLQEEEQRVDEQADRLANALSRYLTEKEAFTYADAYELQPLIAGYVRNHPYQENGIYLRLYKSRKTANSYTLCYKLDPLQKTPTSLHKLESGEVRIENNIFDGTLACVMKDVRNYPLLKLVYFKTLNNEQEIWNRRKRLVLRFGIVEAISMVICMLLVFRMLTKPVADLMTATRKFTKGDHSQKIDPVGWDEIAELAILFNSMADETRRLEAEAEDAKRKQRFLDSFTHEMRTPLTNIYGYSELMKRVRLSEEDRLRYLDYMMHESKRLNRLSQELFNLMVMRGTVTQMKLVDCADLLESVRQTVTPKAFEKGVSLICDQADTSVYGNRALLESLCINLCENAIRACAEGDVVRIGFEDDGKEILLRVADTGMGIAPDQLMHITEPFYRIDKARSRSEGGVGLGLYLCSEIARIHGTNLFFDSREGEGTVVTVRFTKPNLV